MADKKSRDSGRYYVVTGDAIDTLAGVLFGDDAPESFSDAGTARKVQSEMAQRGAASVLVHLPTGAQVAPKKVERVQIESKDFEDQRGVYRDEFYTSLEVTTSGTVSERV